jgi:YidC/Oxa1 family membrane protein insertase
MFGFLAALLNFCYTIWSNYAGMIVIFTFILMVVITPFTVKGMRSAAEMSRLQPEIKKIQDQNKNDRLKQNEEMQALFKEHGVNPLGGCLPTLLPLPIFFIVFRLLEHLNGRKTGAAAPMVRLLRGQIGGPGGYVAPHYLAYPQKLTQAIIHDNGVLKAFGMNLAAKARDHHGSVAAAIPFYVLIIVMTLSQYWQQRQINQRNPAAANANPQMKMTMQLFPAFYALISLNIPATVVFYLLISGLYRMAQNSLSYRYDPVLRRAMQPLPAGTGSGGADGAIDAKSRPKGPAPLPSGKPQSAASAKQSAPPAKAQSPKPQQAGRKAAASAPAAAAAKPGGFMERLRAQAAEAKAQAERSQQERAAKAGGGGGTAAGQGGGRTTPSSRSAPPGRAQGRGSTPPASAGNGKSGPKPKAAPSPAPKAEPVPSHDAEAPPPAAGVEAQIAAAEAEIAAEEAAIDAAIDAAAVEPAPEGDAGNGTPPSRGASPLRVSRPSGRGTPPKGRRPKPGQ